MKDYQVKKDTDGYTVYSYGEYLGRFYRHWPTNSWRVVGLTKMASFKSKQAVINFIRGIS